MVWIENPEIEFSLTFVNLVNLLKTIFSAQDVEMTPAETPNPGLPSGSIGVEGFCNVDQLPFCHTTGLDGDHLIVDPTHEEEILMDGCASVALKSMPT